MTGKQKIDIYRGVVQLPTPVDLFNGDKINAYPQGLHVKHIGKQVPRQNLEGTFDDNLFNEGFVRVEFHDQETPKVYNDKLFTRDRYEDYIGKLGHLGLEHLETEDKDVKTVFDRYTKIFHKGNEDGRFAPLYLLQLSPTNDFSDFSVDQNHIFFLHIADQKDSIYSALEEALKVPAQSS
jgi:hypothetical protein